MAYESERLFLLSLLIAPGCTGRTTTDDDEAQPKRELGEGCRAYYDAAIACYPDYDTGYTYETSGDYPYGPGSYCDYITNQFLDYYGEPCARAMDDVYACLAELECGQLGDGFLELCGDEWKRGHTTCPEIFPSCVCSEGWSSDGACSSDCGLCVDGKRYRAECTVDATGGTSTCTCYVNDVLTQTITGLVDPCNDFETTFHDRCMFP